MLHGKAAAVGGGRNAERAADVQPQGGGGLMAHRFGDAVDVVGGGFEQALRGNHALVHQPLVRCGAVLPQELAGEGTGRHGGAAGQVIDVDGLAEIGLRPCEHRRETFVRALADGVGHVLRLAAIAARRHHQAARDGVGDLRSVVAAHDVEAQVDAGGAAGVRMLPSSM